MCHLFVCSDMHKFRRKPWQWTKETGLGPLSAMRSLKWICPAVGKAWKLQLYQQLSRIERPKAKEKKLENGQKTALKGWKLQLFRVTLYPSKIAFRHAICLSATTGEVSTGGLFAFLMAYWRLLKSMPSVCNFIHSIWHLLCDTIRHLFWQSLSHFTWHPIWHSMWHIFCHLIWHSYLTYFVAAYLAIYLTWHFTWHILWHSISGILSDFLILNLTYFLISYLASHLAFYLAFLPGVFPTFYPTFYRTWHLTYTISDILSIWHSTYLTSFLTRHRVRVWQASESWQARHGVCVSTVCVRVPKSRDWQVEKKNNERSLFQTEIHKMKNPLKSWEGTALQRKNHVAPRPLGQGLRVACAANNLFLPGVPFKYKIFCLHSFENNVGTKHQRIVVAIVDAEFGLSCIALVMQRCWVVAIWQVPPLAHICLAHMIVNSRQEWSWLLMVPSVMSKIFPSTRRTKKHVFPNASGLKNDDGFLGPCIPKIHKGHSWCLS